MLRGHRMGPLILAVSAVAAGCARAPTEPAPAALHPEPTEEGSMIAIQTYTAQLAGVRAQNPAVELSIGRDAARGDEPVLLVGYPAPTADPAGRDVWCDAEHQDWSKGRAITFSVKPDHAVKLSVSFFDRNRVVYTTWTVLEANVWQAVRVAFGEIQPNPYFQPPDAKVGAPLDVSEVKGLAFAPQDPAPGRLSISKFVLTE
jgi:Carbohydrate binding domain (family 11)